MRASAAAKPPVAPPPSRPRSFDIEQALGGNWLNKIGVVILVLWPSYWAVCTLRSASVISR
jgi:uncharacterized membrane protein